MAWIESADRRLLRSETDSGLTERAIMTKVFTVSFSDNETTPEHIEARAAELGITPEMLIRRAIAAHLGEYRLQEVPPGTNVKSITDFLMHSGVLKPGTEQDELCLSSKSPRPGAL
ncbi:hypothetical protein MASR2M16_17230 [Thauera terpenica]